MFALTDLVLTHKRSSFSSLRWPPTTTVLLKTHQQLPNLERPLSPIIGLFIDGHNIQELLWLIAFHSTLDTIGTRNDAMINVDIMRPPDFPVSARLHFLRPEVPLRY